MARHLTEEHPARRRDPTTFSFRVEKAGERPLPRQIREAQKIANETPGRLINAPGHLLDNEAVRGEERRGAGR